MLTTKVISPIWCVVLHAMIVGASLQAQSPKRSPNEIAQIVDAALQAVIPSDRSLSDATVAERGVRFDFGRTMAAFGYDVEDSTARSRLKLQSVVTPGAKALISDCNQLGTMPCKLLGKAAYVYVTPVAVTNSEAEVQVHVTWVTPYSEHAYMSGFSTRVHLSRVGSRAWTFGYISGGTVY